MEIDKGVHEAESIAGNAWKAIENDPVAVLRDETQKRRINVLARESVQFRNILNEEIIQDKYLGGATVTAVSRAELERLKEIQRAFGKRKVIERDVKTHIPKLEAVVLSGQQVARIHDFAFGYTFDGMDAFSESLVRNFPTAPIVTEKQGGIGSFVGKLMGHGK